MKTDLIHSLTSDFESFAQRTETGAEFWLARDLQHLLGYAEWRNFALVITKDKTACEISGHAVPDHFVEVNKMVELGSGSTREVQDLMLTHEMGSESRISKEHVTNNKAVRDTLISRGIRPESLLPAEDVKMVARRLTATEKKALKSRDCLDL